MAIPRAQIVDPNEKGLYHCYSRCVRQAFLMGPEHDDRRAWVEQQLKFLCSIFAADDAAHSAMGNHLHVLVRLDPPRAAGWSREEVVRRYFRLHPRTVMARGGKPVKRGQLPPAEIPADVLAAVVANRRLVRIYRKRLASLSWFMKSLKEPLARLANAQDKVTGTFFEGRFKSPRVLDVAGLLTCMVYVDLNPVRAEIAEGLADSLYTSVRLRLYTLQRFAESNVLRDTLPASEMAQLERLVEEEMAKAGLTAESFKDVASPQLPTSSDDTWLAPIGGEGEGSQEPLLGMEPASYIQIVEAAGRAPAAGKKGMIAEHVQPVLQKLGIDVQRWLKVVTKQGRLYGTAIGTKASLAAEAARRGMKRIVGALQVHLSG